MLYSWSWGKVDDHRLTGSDDKVPLSVAQATRPGKSVLKQRVTLDPSLDPVPPVAHALFSAKSTTCQHNARGHVAGRKIEIRLVMLETLKHRRAKLSDCFSPRGIVGGCEDKCNSVTSMLIAQKSKK